MSTPTLGIDLGGTKTAIGLVQGGSILDRRTIATPQQGFDSVIDAIVSTAQEVLSGTDGVRAAGIGSPGPLDFATGRIRWAPNIYGMDDKPLVQALADGLGMHVEMENDANAAGYAEHLYGAASGLESSIFVTLSTGIGGGLFIGDRVIRGAHGLGGEIGHMIMLPGGPLGGDGHLGTLEGIAAGRSIGRDATYAYGKEMTSRDVFSRAAAGEQKAVRLVDNAADFTAMGLANLSKIFDPHAFVLGGGLAMSGDFYLDRVKDRYRHHMEGYPAADVLLARLGGDAGLVGAAAVAARSLESE